MSIKNIFDSHSHYDDGRFDADRYEVIEGQLNGSVCGIIHAGTSIKSSEFGIETARRYKNFYTAVGIHPEEIDELEEDWFERLEKLATKDKVVAIGEIGLDYHYLDGVENAVEVKEKQRLVFERQLELAKGLNLPVIVHMRDCTQDCLDILKMHRPCGVMHCFSGSSEVAKEVLELGMYISFTGVLTFKNAKKTVKAFCEVPTERLLLETDCPYMAPEPLRSKRCQSSMIEHTAMFAAQLKGMEVQQFIDCCTENTRRLFKIQ